MLTPEDIEAILENERKLRADEYRERHERGLRNLDKQHKRRDRANAAQDTVDGTVEPVVSLWNPSSWFKPSSSGYTNNDD